MPARDIKFIIIMVVKFIIIVVKFIIILVKLNIIVVKFIIIGTNIYNHHVQTWEGGNLGIGIVRGGSIRSTFPENI